MEVVLRIFFLDFSNSYFQYGIEKFTWKSYTIIKALLITSQVELINKREFAQATLNKNSKTFMIYMAVLEAGTLIYLLQIA